MDRKLCLKLTTRSGNKYQIDVYSSKAIVTDIKTNAEFVFKGYDYSDIMDFLEGLETYEREGYGLPHGR